MPLGTKVHVGLGPRHIVVDGTQLPLQKTARPYHFSAHVYCGQTAGWIKMPISTEVGLGPSDRGTAAPTFRTMSIMAKRSPI